MATITKRIGRTGKVSYQAIVRLGTSPSQTKTFERLSDAKAWAQRLEADLRGRKVSSFRPDKHRLSELVAEYTAKVLPHKAVGKVQAVQLSWWVTTLHDPYLTDLLPQDISRARDIRARQEGRNGQLSPSTVVRYLAALSHCLSWGVKELAWLTANPCKSVSKPREPRGRVRMLSQDERSRLLLETAKYPVLHCIVLIALTTGCRSTEIRFAYWDVPAEPPKHAWSVIDLERSLLIVMDSKNGGRRSLPLVDEVVQHLPPRGTGLVFPGSVRKQWERALKDAEVHDFRFHDLRHDAASTLAKHGFSVLEIMAALGHKSPAMASRYSHLTESHTIEKMRKVFG